MYRLLLEIPFILMFPFLTCSLFIYFFYNFLLQIDKYVWVSYISGMYVDNRYTTLNEHHQWQDKILITNVLKIK